MTAKSIAVITGASGGIAQALIEHLSRESDLELHAVSRAVAPDESPAGVHWHVCDYSDAALGALAQSLTEADGHLEYLFVTNGLLHSDGVFPERALRELNESAMSAVFATNTLLPMRVLAAMTPMLRKADAPRIVALSARVGSIGDNGLGGWYSYRGSKAALNMMLRCAAIEFRRLNRSAKIIAFHPGTTDTSLSKPFQARVPADRLFTPSFVAEQLWQIVQDSRADGELSYLDWAGQEIPW